MYKKYSSFILIIFTLFSFTNLSAEQIKISYIDVEKIMSESTVGKKINKRIESLIKKKNKEFQKVEKDLKAKEAEISKQQNILSKDELNKKINSLKSDISNYRNLKKDFNNEMNKKRLKATSQLVVYLNKILGKYASDNSISLIIQKKNIVIGKAEMDITKEVLKIFDKEVKDVKLN
tara:strand:+ start:140 stop:670 length:531 start_codon:yes stop_codon:yes gene_type:complete